MSVELVPYTKFETPGEVRELAERLVYLVDRNRSHLHSRSLHGPLDRYGQGVDRAIKKIYKGRTDEDPKHLLPVDETGNVWGGASQFIGLDLTRPRAGIPPAYAHKLHAQKLLIAKYPHATPNVAGWVDESRRELLPEIYAQLVDPYVKRLGGLVLPRYVYARPWTLESTAAPDYVHEAIVMSGLQEVITSSRFDDGEAGRHRPGEATLYSVFRDPTLPARAKLAELRNGPSVPPNTSIID